MDLDTKTLSSHVYAVLRITCLLCSMGKRTWSRRKTGQVRVVFPLTPSLFHGGQSTVQGRSQVGRHNVSGWAVRSPGVRSWGLWVLSGAFRSSERW